LMMFSQEIIRLLFERGEFGAYSTSVTSGALSYYAIGLCCFAWSRILVTSFHALQDTKTPVKVAGLCLVVNIILNILWMGPLKISGIALASSVSSLVNVVILFRILDQRLKFCSRDLGVFIVKILLASVLMAVVSRVSWLWVTFASHILQLTVVLLVSFLSFFIFCLILKVDQAKRAMQWIFKSV
jgi:putative peptidoglycan lipid II flippase